MTILLRALGYNNEQMLRQFFEINTFHIAQKDGVELELVPERDECAFELSHTTPSTVRARGTCAT